jgi:hypothetical protein
MATLEQKLQEIHDAGIGVCITWLWDGGVDVRVLKPDGTVADDTNVAKIADILPWLKSEKHFLNAPAEPEAVTMPGPFQPELQKIYDSEINVEISWTRDGPIAVKLGNEFTGFNAEGTVTEISEVLQWLQEAIHSHYPESQYDVERLGGKFTATIAEMDGDIVYPGDLHGRTILAIEIDLAWDSNAMCALVGEDLVVGVSGFGAMVHDALRDLADHLVQEAVWIEIPEGLESPPQLRPAENTTIQTNVVELYRAGEGKICAAVSPENSPIGVCAEGESVHDAIRDLANKLVARGVYVEVTMRREWIFGDTSESGQAD